MKLFVAAAVVSYTLVRAARGALRDLATDASSWWHPEVRLPVR